MDRRLKMVWATMLASVLILSLAMTGCSPGFTPAKGPQVGKQAPDFKLTSLDGQPVSLSDFRGKLVLLNFWASWCPPCRFEMPFLQQIDEEWAEAPPLVVVGVNIGESPEVVEKFMKEYALSFLVLLDSNESVSQQYNVRAIPATFLIGEDGMILGVKIGAFQSTAEIEAAIRKVMP